MISAILGAILATSSLSSSTQSIKVDPAVSSAVSGLRGGKRLSRGLQDQCVDVYDDLEGRARKAGAEFLRNSIDNWHIVKKLDGKFDKISEELKNQENDFRKKYEKNVIGLANRLQSLGETKKEKKNILKHQADMTATILELNDIAAKKSRVGFYHQIKFLSRDEMPCLKAIYERWEDLHKELGSEEIRTTEIEAEEDSRLGNLRRRVESQINDYGKKVKRFFEEASSVDELKIRLREAGFSPQGDLKDIDS